MKAPDTQAANRNETAKNPQTLLCSALLVMISTLLLSTFALRAAKGEHAPKSPEAKVRVTGQGKVVAYHEGKSIVIHVTSGHEKGKKLHLTIPEGQWPHLGSVFFEVIFEPPKGFESNFPVHSPMKPEMVKSGEEVWFALEGSSSHSLRLYQLACHVRSGTPAKFNAVVRNAVKLREKREQEEIARDYQCRLIEFPKGSGHFPDDPALLEKFVRPDSIFPNRLDVQSPPPGHKGYGKGLKSSDVYANGIGSAARNRKER